MIIKQITKKYTGLNQFSVRNEHYQGSTMKQPIFAQSCIVTLFCAGFGFVQEA